MAAMQKNRRLKYLAASTALAVCSAGAVNLAIAACTFALAQDGPTGQDLGNGLYLVQFTPSGNFSPSDGRPMDVPSWHINAQLAADVIARNRARLKPVVIDYEHQTLNKEKNGQPAPAAGWLRELRWVEGKGLFGVVYWTPQAKTAIASLQYLYFSPVFRYSKETGDVLDIHMGAITNDPGVHGMEPLSLLAAATAAFLPAHQEQTTMNPLLAAVLATLGLPATTDEKGAVAALTAVGSIKDLQTKAAAGEAATHVATAACTALNLAPDAKAETVTAALTAAVAKPDPAKFVPVETVTAMQTELAALTSKQLDADIDAAVKPALEDGRLLPAQEPWARDLGKSNMAALTAFLDKAPKIAALSSTQTQGQPPAQTAKGDAQLSASELAVCTALGMSPEQYKAGAA